MFRINCIDCGKEMTTKEATIMREHAKHVYSFSCGTCHEGRE